jgi:hypothetical protein
MHDEEYKETRVCEHCDGLGKTCDCPDKREDPENCDYCGCKHLSDGINTYSKTYGVEFSTCEHCEGNGIVEAVRHEAVEDIIKSGR